MDLKEVAAASAEELLRKFRTLTAQHKHRGLRGAARERIVRDFLTEILSSNVAVGSGEVYDTENVYSSESDVIIYDPVRVPLLFSEASQIFPVEGVYGTLEVKSKLDSQELEDCLTKCNKAKSLCKSSFYKDAPQYGILGIRTTARGVSAAFRSVFLQFDQSDSSYEKT